MDLANGNCDGTTSSLSQSREKEEATNELSCEGGGVSGV